MTNLRHKAFVMVLTRAEGAVWLGLVKNGLYGRVDRETWGGTQPVLDPLENFVEIDALSTAIDFSVDDETGTG